MAGLSLTTLDLAGLRGRWRDVLAAAAGRIRVDGARDAGRLEPVLDFGSNPGALRMFAYAPPELAPAPALVVVLHGCKQDALGYDLGAGWSSLADRYGFVVLCPQQERVNNPNLCFNWFLPSDATRERGEALSIRQMIERAVKDHGIDRDRIYVTGLSAGGAMTSVMLATYPEVFAGGGVVAGLPYGTAGNVHGALRSMADGAARPASAWGDLVRKASLHRGRWPRISVWHGDADAVVAPVNAREVEKQWSDLHGLSETADAAEIVDGHRRQVWRDEAGRELIESFTIAGMGHGAPITAGRGDDDAGQAGPFLIETGISSSFHMAKFWGLTSAGVRHVSRSREEAAAASPAQPPRSAAAEGPGGDRLSGDVGSVITAALRKAGLIKP